jgi:hypothetical protein
MKNKKEKNLGRPKEKKGRLWNSKYYFDAWIRPTNRAYIAEENWHFAKRKERKGDGKSLIIT